MSMWGKFKGGIGGALGGIFPGLWQGIKYTFVSIGHLGQAVGPAAMVVGALLAATVGPPLGVIYGIVKGGALGAETEQFGAGMKMGAKVIWAKAKDEERIKKEILDRLPQKKEKNKEAPPAEISRAQSEQPSVPIPVGNKNQKIRTKSTAKTEPETHRTHLFSTRPRAVAVQPTSVNYHNRKDSTAFIETIKQIIAKKQSKDEHFECIVTPEKDRVVMTGKDVLEVAREIIKINKDATFSIDCNTETEMKAALTNALLGKPSLTITDVSYQQKGFGTVKYSKEQLEELKESILKSFAAQPSSTAKPG